MIQEALPAATNAVKTAYDRFTEPLFSIGEASFSAAGIVKLLVFLVLTFWFSRLLRRFLGRRFLPRFGVEKGAAYAIGNLASYLFITGGLLIGLQTSGIDLSAITVALGALGVGIGFGLQTIVSNFVSGLILLMERPIQVGDRIQIGDLHGQVTRIRPRATDVLTNDNIAVIVPNSEFISNQVINWTHTDPKMRIRVPVGVAYGSDVETVRKALLEAADAADGVLKDPKPNVRFTSFGDSSLNFEVLVWTTELIQRRGECISRVNFAIHAALERHGVQIPFPQRDLHVKGPVPVRLEEGASTPS